MKIILTLSLVTTLLALSTSAQDAQHAPAPKAPSGHAWLKQFTGEWSMSKSMGSEVSGSMSSRMLGQHWVMNAMKADVNGISFESLQTLGYDTKKKKYVGTWVDSMMNYMWHYEGVVDASGKKLVLDTTGPNFTNGEMTPYRDSYEFKSADLMIATSEMQDGEGKWITIMTAELKRRTP